MTKEGTVLHKPLEINAVDTNDGVSIEVWWDDFGPLYTHGWCMTKDEAHEGASLLDIISRTDDAYHAVFIDHHISVIDSMIDRMVCMTGSYKRLLAHKVKTLNEELHEALTKQHINA